MQVGTLKITICDAESASTAAAVQADEKKPKTSIVTILLRIGIVVFLAAILVFCSILFAMLQREKKRRRSRRNPRVLSRLINYYFIEDFRCFAGFLFPGNGNIAKDKRRGSDGTGV